MLHGISKLAEHGAPLIQPTDWKELAKFPPSRSVDDIRTLFYPSASAEAESPEHQKSLTRRSKFLAQLDSETYHRVYEYIVANPNLQFPNIHKILAGSRKQGKALSELMDHVVQWLQPKSDLVKRGQPWQEFLPVLSKDEAKARNLQKEILDLAYERTAELANPSGALLQLPSTGKESYPDRFKFPIWKEILGIVHRAVGPQFQGIMSQFNTPDLSLFGSAQLTPSLLLAVRGAIAHIPDVACNPILRDSNALDTLMTEISPSITAWALKLCTDGLQDIDLGRRPPLPSSAREVVSRQVNELESARLPLNHSDEGRSPSIVASVASESQHENVERVLSDHTHELDDALDDRQGWHDTHTPANTAPEKSKITSPADVLDAVSNLDELKKRHRQTHSVKPLQTNARSPSTSKTHELPGAKMKKTHSRSAAGSITKTSTPKTAGKLPAWMASPATHARLQTRVRSA